MDKQLKHDFINNTMRLDIVGKLISEALNANEPIDKQLLSDYTDFLKAQINLFEDLKSTIHSN